MGWRWIDCKYFSHLAVSKNNCFSSYVSEYKSQVFVPTANWFLTLSRCHWHNTKTVLISWNLNKYLVRAANTYHEQTKIANLVKISWFVLSKLVSFLAPKQSVIKANSTHFKRYSEWIFDASCNLIDSVKWVWLGPPRINVTTFVNLLSQALLFQILYCHFVTMAEPEIFQQCHQHLVLYHILCFYPKSKQFVRNIQYKSENSINNVLQHILEHSLFDVMSHIICILASVNICT